MSERDQRIVDVIRSLREGEVVTYGDIAEDAGYPIAIRFSPSVKTMNASRPRSCAPRV